MNATISMPSVLKKVPSDSDRSQNFSVSSHQRLEIKSFPFFHPSQIFANWERKPRFYDNHLFPDCLLRFFLCLSFHKCETKEVENHPPIFPLSESLHQLWRLIEEKLNKHSSSCWIRSLLHCSNRQLIDLWSSCCFGKKIWAWKKAQRNDDRAESQS